MSAVVRRMVAGRGSGGRNGRLVRRRNDLRDRTFLCRTPGLTRMHHSFLLMHMRTTLNIDEELLHRAAKLTGVEEKTSLVRLGLQALIARESARRLARLGGSEESLRPIPRRRLARTL